MGNTDSSEGSVAAQKVVIYTVPSIEGEEQVEEQPNTSISHRIDKLGFYANFAASKCKFQDQMLKSMPVQAYKIEFKSMDLANYSDLTEKSTRRRFSHTPQKSKQNVFETGSHLSGSVSVSSLDFLKFIKEECVYDYYGVLQKIKKGERGEIFAVEQKETSIVKILKIISKVSFRERNLIKGVSQIQNLLKLQHPNIVKLLQAYEDINRYYMIFEKIGGISLLEYVRRNKITEQVGKQVIKKLLEALQYTHSNGIIHRNIRLENIMIEPPHEESPIQVKLIDFGMSLTIEEAIAERHSYGSIFYAPPESLDHKINSKYDIWSVGILTLILFLDPNPTHFWNSNYLQEILKRGEYFRQHLRKLPLHIKQFVFQLLTLKNKRRPSAAEALKIEWISGIKGLYKSRIRKGMNIDEELTNRP